MTAVFELEDTDFDAIEEIVGVRPPASTYVKASRFYDGSLRADAHRALEDHTSIEAVSAAAKARAKEVGGGKETARVKVIEKVPAELDRPKQYVERGLDGEEHDQLIELLPKFFYFSTYEMLPGDCDLHALAERAKTWQWRRADETMMSLLRLAGEGPDDFLDEDYASRKAELQAASLDLSAQVFEYWKLFASVFAASWKYLEYVQSPSDMLIFSFGYFAFSSLNWLKTPTIGWSQTSPTPSTLSAAEKDRW